MIHKIKTAITALTVILLISSCYKREDSITKLETTYGADLAYIKLVNTYTAPSPSAASPAAGPSVNIFVNDVRINSTAVSYAGTFPAAPTYTGITSGLAINIKFILNRASGVPAAGDTLSNKNYDLGANSYTTFYLTDTTPNPTPFNPYIVSIQELVTNAPVGYFRARFVNMIPSNDTLEVFSKRLNAVIFSGQLYKNATQTVEIPTFIVADTLTLRKVSAPATALATTSLTSPFLPTSSRTYTFYCTGNITGTPKARALSTFTNR
jgi:hypothetical protein